MPRPDEANDVWAVDAFGTVIHWDGTAWMTDMLNIGMPVDGSVSRYAINRSAARGFGANDVRIAGVLALSESISPVFEWNSAMFIELDSGTTLDLFGMCGDGREAWAVGGLGAIVH